MNQEDDYGQEDFRHAQNLEEMSSCIVGGHDEYCRYHMGEPVQWRGNSLPPLQPIPMCQLHGIVGCRQCFPSLDVSEMRQDHPPCHTHGIVGCQKCWGVR